MQFAPLFLNYLLMVAMPLLLGWFLAHRRHVSWRLFGIGAATFILSQLAHIPFNYVIINNWLAELTLVSERAELLVSAAFLGLSAGFFEEGARYLSYRFWAKDARSYGKGLMLGAGHGGMESLLLGVFGALNVTILIAYRAGYLQGLVPVEQAPLVGVALDQISALPWFEMMLGAVERASVLCIQLALSLMVMQVFTRGKLRWLLFAFCWHALIDAAVVVAVDGIGIYMAEAFTVLAALVSLAVVFMLRAPEPEEPEPEPLARPRQPAQIGIRPSKEKLEDSRYY